MGRARRFQEPPYRRPRGHELSFGKGTGRLLRPEAVPEAGQLHIQEDFQEIGCQFQITKI